MEELQQIRKAFMQNVIHNPEVRVVINKRDPRDIRIVDVSEYHEFDLAYSILERHAKAEKALHKVEEKTIEAEFRYNPYDLELLKIDPTAKSLPVFNLYQPPRHALQQRTLDQLPGVFDDFLTYLLAGVDEAKEHFLDVLATMLRKRVEIIPCLIGAGGIGKNTLVEHFLQRLVGAPNHWYGRQQEVKTNFTQWAESRQVIVYDEVRLNDDAAIAAMKQRTNETFVVEGKGVNQYTATNFATSFILSNRMDALGEFVDDRRAAVYPLTDVPIVNASELLNKHGGSLEAFRARLLDPETVANVFWFLKARNVPSVLVTYRHKETYEALKEAGCRGENQDLIDKVVERLQNVGEMTLADVGRLGWSDASLRQLAKLFRDAQNHEGRKVFKLGSGRDSSTKISLR